MIPDILKDARDEAARRTNGRVFILSPGRGDFRLDGERGAPPDFAEGAGLTAHTVRGKLYVDMGDCWYRAAADRWNKIEIPAGWSDHPDAHLCARLIGREARAAEIAEDERRLMRGLMQAPHIIVNGGETRRARAAAQYAARLRPLFARALAEKRSVYALRGCACMLAALMGGPVPVMIINKG